MNLYTYANGDPINNSDLDGRFTSTVYMTTRATVIDAWNDTRFQGFLNVADGAWKTSAGLSMTVASEGFLAPVGVALSAQGIDSLYTGIRQIYTGEVQTKAFVQALTKTGLSYEQSVMADSVLGSFLDVKNAAWKASCSLASTCTTLSRSSPAQVMKYKPFTEKYYRHNLKVFTGLSPPSNIHAHHVFPQNYKQYFSSKGINIHDPKNLTWWESESHRRNAANYNAAWSEFIRKNENPSIFQIFDQGRELMKQNDINVHF